MKAPSDSSMTQLVEEIPAPPSIGIPPSSNQWLPSSVQPRSAGPWWRRLGGVFFAVRPHQLRKNVFVLAPIVFAKEIFDPPLLLRAPPPFLGFHYLAGAVY